MSNRSRTALAVVLAITGLSACHRPAPGPSAHAPTGAANDTPAALMKEAFPSWDGSQYAVVVTAPGPAPKEGDGTESVALDPATVVTLDDAHRVLMLTGAPADEKGQPDFSHVNVGSVGARWFELRQGRWFVSASQDSILWSGSSGDAGKVKALDLGPTRHGVAVESGGCWQGSCATWLGVIELEADRARVVLSDLQLASDSADSSDTCQALLNAADASRPASAPLAASAPASSAASAATVASAAASGAASAPDADGESNDAPGTEPPPDATGCFAVEGKWQVRALAGSDRGDIVVTYTGLQGTGGADAGPAMAKPVAETLVLRYGKDGYKPFSGRVAAPGL